MGSWDLHLKSSFRFPTTKGWAGAWWSNLDGSNSALWVRPIILRQVQLQQEDTRAPIKTGMRALETWRVWIIWKCAVGRHSRRGAGAPIYLSGLNRGSHKPLTQHSLFLLPLLLCAWCNWISTTPKCGYMQVFHNLTFFVTVWSNSILLPLLFLSLSKCILIHNYDKPFSSHKL